MQCLKGPQKIEKALGFKRKAYSLCIIKLYFCYEEYSCRIIRKIPIIFRINNKFKESSGFFRTKTYIRFSMKLKSLLPILSKIEDDGPKNRNQFWKRSLSIYLINLEKLQIKTNGMKQQDNFLYFPKVSISVKENIVGNATLNFWNKKVNKINLTSFRLIHNAGDKKIASFRVISTQNLHIKMDNLVQFKKIIQKTFFIILELKDNIKQKQIQINKGPKNWINK